VTSEELAGSAGPSINSPVIDAKTDKRHMLSGATGMLCSNTIVMSRGADTCAAETDV